MGARTRGKAAQEASTARDSLLHTVAALVFAYLPLSVQAITLPALSKAWKEWAEEQRAKARALEQAEYFDYNVRGRKIIKLFYVPLWVVQQHRGLSEQQKRRFQLRAVAEGDVGAVASVGGVGSSNKHHRRLCALAAYVGKLQALQWLRQRHCE